MEVWRVHGAFNNPRKPQRTHKHHHPIAPSNTLPCSYRTPLAPAHSYSNQPADRIILTIIYLHHHIVISLTRVPHRYQPLLNRYQQPPILIIPPNPTHNVPPPRRARLVPARPKPTPSSPPLLPLAIRRLLPPGPRHPPRARLLSNCAGLRLHLFPAATVSAWALRHEMDVRPE
jgi:hypothetical protein